MKFTKNPRNFLVFCGNPGIGKTHLCASLVPWAMTNFHSFRYWKERDLLGRVRQGIDEYNCDYHLVLKDLIDDDLIMIDDIGSTGYTDWREEILFSALDTRYNMEKPTLITSNFSAKEFKEIYKLRIYDRVFNKENTVIEIMDGESHRQA